MHRAVSGRLQGVLPEGGGGKPHVPDKQESLSRSGNVGSPSALPPPPRALGTQVLLVSVLSPGGPGER